MVEKLRRLSWPKPSRAQLAPEVDDVGLGAGARVGAGLHRVLLSGQTEGVETQRVQYITADHPEVAGVHIGGDVAQRMADVQPLTRRIREHVLARTLSWSSGTAEPSVGASDPTGLGTLKVPIRVQIVTAQARSMRPASSAV